MTIPPLSSRSDDGRRLVSVLLVFLGFLLGATDVEAASPCGLGFVYCPMVEYEVLPGDMLKPEETLDRIVTLYSRMSRSPVTRKQLVLWNDLEHQQIKSGTKLVIFYSPKHKRAKMKARAPRKKGAHRASRRRSDFGIKRVRGHRGMVEPYPLAWVIRGFGKCTNGKREHPAIDIAGVGPKYGLGTPVRAMVRSQVVSIHLPEHNPARYGTRDKREGSTRRFGTALPRAKKVPGYGKVRFFTTDLGSARTGVMLVTRGILGEFKEYEIRYMHLGAIHPRLKVGSVLRAGDEIGVMGSTAILESVPHVHIDITSPGSRRINVAQLLGVDIPVEPCGRRK
jgi:hypothetical protein